MTQKPNKTVSEDGNPDKNSNELTGRRLRADAQRNVELVLEAAKFVFNSSGVEAPVREIAERAGVGLGTIYRHFPQRADLIAAVFRHEVDACAAAAPEFAAAHEPGEALAAWMQRYAIFLVTKRGLAPALHSGDPAMLTLRDYFDENMRPALEMLLKSAVAAGKIRSDVTSNDILYAVGGLCMSSHFEGLEHVQKMVAILIDGLRYGK